MVPAPVSVIAHRRVTVATMKDGYMTLSTFLHSMTRRLTRRRTDQRAADHNGVAATPRHAANECATQHISRALDRAMELGLFEHAERIVRSALRLHDAISPQLIERIARLKLIQGRPEHALEIIETRCEQTSSLRMLRIVCQLLVGRRLDAHIELHRWSRHNACPLEARCLLALLEDELGNADDAQRELLKNIRQLDDPQTFELMVLIAAGRGRRDLAIIWAERLLRVVQSRSAALSPRLLVESLELPVKTAIVITQDDIESLASELVVNEPVIPALTTAQELEPDLDTARLLRSAVECALPELSRRDTAFESLVRLAIVLDERHQAMKWVERAIDENRITPTMVRLAHKLIDSEEQEDERLPLAHDDDSGVVGRVIDALHKRDQDADPDEPEQWKRAA